MVVQQNRGVVQGSEAKGRDLLFSQKAAVGGGGEDLRRRPDAQLCARAEELAPPGVLLDVERREGKAPARLPLLALVRDAAHVAALGLRDPAPQLGLELLERGLGRDANVECGLELGGHYVSCQASLFRREDVRPPLAYKSTADLSFLSIFLVT